MGGGGMVRAIGKIGKRLCFPSAPSSWVSAIVYKIQRYQDRRPKSEVLFPFRYPRDRDDRDRTKDEVDEGGSQTCPPMRPVSNKEYSFCFPFETVSEFLRSQSQIPEYDDLAAACTTIIQIGEQFDVVSLLEIGSDNNNSLFRLNGDTVELQHLKGKNVLVFCVHVPVFWNSMSAANIRALPLACTRAFSGNNNNNNYEAVIVPRMRRDWTTDRDAFDHFLSGFPSSWLAIPFSHPLRRDSICKSLGLTSCNSFMCLFVDQTQKVLHHGSSFNRYLSYYEIHSNNISYVPWWENCQLHTMLGCNPSDYVYKLNPAPAPAPAPGISISELNNKLVGLYMCKDGSFIRTLSLVHQECKSKGMDFEIVLIYLPVLHEAVNPQLFQDAVNHVILQDLKIDSWWVLPYDDRRHQRFKHNRKTFADDELFIVGPHNEFVEPYGRQVIYRFGFNAYPFSFQHVVEKRYQEIRGLTFEYLLGDRFLFNDYDEVTAQGLRGKIVLLYMDYAHSLNYALYFPLLEWYYTIKRTRNLSSDSDFEVVFVDLLGQYGDAPLHMPWRRCSFDPQHAAFLTDSLGIAECGGIVAFGKDARILTLYAQHLLQSCDLDVIQSYKGLRNDVYKNVQLDYVVNQTFDD